MMFNRISEWVKRVIKMLSKSDVRNKIGVDVAVSDQMASAINLWGRMYEGRAPWLNDTTQSLNLSVAIASEMARLVTLELQTEVSGSARADYLNEQYQVVISDIRAFTEYACAKSGLIFKPYVTGDGIGVSYVQADCFFPTAFDSSGRIIGAVFADQVTRGDRYYTRLEYHDLTGDTYTVINKAYRSSTQADLGTEVPLTEIEDWADLQEHTTIQHIGKPLFGYFKIPLANSIDPQAPLGVSVYARAVDLIREADRQYSRILWEYEGSELAVDADSTLFKRDERGNYILPQGKERLFRALDLDDNNSKYNVFSPAIRDESLFNGLNRLFQRIEFACGLAYGTLSDPQTVEKTAEEIKSSKQRSYAMVVDIQKALQTALEDMVYAMDTLCTLYHLAPAGTYEMSFEFDDSIVADRQAEFAEKQQLVTAGIMQPWEFRMWYFGETEAQAKAMTADTDEDEGAEHDYA